MRYLKRTALLLIWLSTAARHAELLGRALRNVDLSWISSNMLGGIEVRKSISPDQDADAIGGTVDLKFKEAPSGFKVDVLGQGDYNR
ncbi:MAG TPA: hypothetical protein VFG50_16250 [Rhodothermales bacterium]|nr:hypothetical protein [Rhodothermales bacterium]